VAYQNDNLDEVVGKYVTEAGFKNVYLLAPNYPAGKDHLGGFKRYYKGCHRRRGLHQAGPVGLRGRDCRPARGQTGCRVLFLPGGMGINFLKQYAQAGLNQTIPVFGPAFSFDERLLQAVKDAAIGVKNGSQWSHDLDNPANRQFVDAFKKPTAAPPPFTPARATMPPGCWAAP
jgi:branched-chain amino acid transport system substrate-binding protein